jgi:hypothetical protein
MSRRNPYYDSRAPETIFNSPYLSDFSFFPIGNPKQIHYYPPIFPKPKKEVFLKVEIHLLVQ